MREREPAKILVIDDSEVIRVLFAHLLRRWGFLVITASDAASGLAIAAAEAVDAVFTDLELPEKSGLEVCRTLRGIAEAQGRELPVWLMSGSDDRDYTAEATEAGARGFIRKPFNPADVSQRLTEVFG